MEEILLDLKNVRKQYANFSLECSMQVKRGSITGLIGANGAGKTTIFKASLGLIHTDGGEIRMMGKDTAAADKRRMGKDRSGTFQCDLSEYSDGGRCRCDPEKDVSSV